MAKSIIESMLFQAQKYSLEVFKTQNDKSSKNDISKNYVNITDKITKK